MAHCRCKFVLSSSNLAVEIIWNEIQMCSTIIEDVQRVTKSESRNILIILSPCKDRDLPERDERTGMLKMISLGTLHRLREHIRTKYKLDVEIWSLRNIKKPNREIVEEKMKKADVVLLEIMTITNAWEGTESSWTRWEWKRVMEIRRRILADGKRWWEANPPWEDD